MSEARGRSHHVDGDEPDGEAAAHKLLSIGQYPDVSLLQARTERDEAKAMVRAGKDPRRCGRI